MNSNLDILGGLVGDELYMIASRSGRILQAAPGLSAALDNEPTGRNLNDLFSEELAARLILQTNAHNVYEFDCSLAGCGYRGGARLSDSNVIVMVLAPMANNGSKTGMADLTRYLCREISSDLSTLYMVLHALEQNNIPESTMGLLRQSLYDLTRISKTAAACADLSEGFHFADIRNADLTTEIFDLLERVCIHCGLHADIVIDRSLLVNPVPASVDLTALQRILLNLIAWLLRSSPRTKPALHIRPEYREDMLIVQLQTAGSRLPERLPLQSPEAQPMPGQNIELELATLLTRKLDGTLLNTTRTDGSILCRLSLPVLPSGSRTLNSLQIDWYGGQDIVKVELAGVLPSETYEKHPS